MDSTKVEIISKPLDQLVAKLTQDIPAKSSIWDTLIPLIIGAALTLITQFFIEYWKSNKEKRKRKQELISKGKAKTYLIAQILKDLSMYKVHKQYYFRASQLDIKQSDKEDSYKKHYEKGQEQRLTETKLDENIAEYFEIVTEYIILNNNKNTFEKNFEDIFHFLHPKSSKFENFTSQIELIEELEKEEGRLMNEYKGLNDLLNIIQGSMK